MRKLVYEIEEKEKFFLTRSKLEESVEACLKWSKLSVQIAEHRSRGNCIYRKRILFRDEGSSALVLDFGC